MTTVEKLLVYLETHTDYQLYVRIVAFVNSIEFSKSKNTIIAYLYDLLIGIRFFANDDKTKWAKIQSLTIPEFRSLCALRRERNVSIASQQRMIAAWKMFFRFHKLENISTFRTPKFLKRLPRPISKTSIENIVSTAPKNWLEARNKALWILMYSSGMRISEALSIKVDQIKADTQSIVVKGKGDKDRIIPLLPIALQYIEEYLAKRPSNNEYIFIGRKHSKLSQQTAAHIFKHWKEIYNLPDKITLHSFRHGFATHLLQNELPLTGIQKLLGHKSLTTTSQYIQIFDKSLELSYIRCMQKKNNI